MTCTELYCDEEAIYVVYWPGKTVYKCAAHAELAQKVANAMGFDVVVREIGEDQDG